MTFSIQMPGFEIEKKEQKCAYEIESILNGQAQIEAWVWSCKSQSKYVTSYDLSNHSF